MIIAITFIILTLIIPSKMLHSLDNANVSNILKLLSWTK
jgi:hypothetical protein